MQRFIEIVHFKCGLDEVGLPSHTDFFAPETQRDIFPQVIDGSFAKGRGSWNPIIAHDRGPVEPVALLVRYLQKGAAGSQFRMLSKPFRQFVLVAPLDISLDELTDSFGSNHEFLIHGFMNAVAHFEVSAYSKRRQHHGENRKIPGGQAEPDGKRHHALVVSRIVYPVPRTVWISFTLWSRSTLFRNKLIKASSVFSSMSSLESHTECTIVFLGTTRPARRIRNSSKRNSVRLREISSPARLASWVAGFKTRSATCRSVGRGTEPRRETERSRARNSSKENGFVM